MNVRSELFVRKSTGLVREASALDATIFNAVLSAPVGVTLAWSLFFTLAAFPGADVVSAIVIAMIACVPVLIMFALLATSMPRVGGDYVWVSRILTPPLGVMSNFAIAAAGILGATFFAKFFSVFALGPILASLGVLLTNTTLVDWGNSFQTDTNWILAAGFAAIVLETVIMVAGTKVTFRAQNICFVLAMGGTFLALLVLLIGSQTDFLSNFNSLNAQYGGGTAQDVITAAGAAGASPDLGNFDATLPTVYVVMGFMMWNWWSVYMSGELKSAASRSRQLMIMFGALLWDGLLILVGALLLFKVTGYDFLVAVNQANTAYAIPTGAWFQFLASLVYNNPILTVLIVGSFLFWSLPGMIANIYMPIRSVFAWSFDRLLPEKLSEVNENTHSPVPAIVFCNVLVALCLVWATESADFQTLLGLVVLAGAMAVLIVSIAAIALPTRRADLYSASPANLNVFGIPILYIVGVLSIVVFAFLVYLALQFPALVMAGDVANLWWIPTWLIGLAIAGLALYYGASFIRARQGIDISLVYRELPPE
jgi:APA family basic amino acid/polyamine antiporter